VFEDLPQGVRATSLIKTCEARTSSGGIGLQFTEGELQGAVESSREAPQVGEWLNKFSQRERLIHFAEISKEGWTVEISWRDFTRTRGPLDLAKVQGDYSVNIQRFEAQEEVEPSIWVIGTIRSARDIAYRHIASWSTKLLERE
jgi:hypothetical protein